MEIRIVQSLLIGLWTAVCLAGNLLGIYTNRCLVMATGVGLILGDLPTGLAMGAVGELREPHDDVRLLTDVPPTGLRAGSARRPWHAPACCPSSTHLSHR